MSEISNVQSRIAGLAGDNHTINGVAIGPGDITRGLSGDWKVWEADALQTAAESLEGTAVNPLHSQAEVGEVTRAGFAPDRGVVYEVELEDENLAEQVADGNLEVSIEARHADGGRVDTEQGEAMRAENIEFTGLALVQHGAAPSASAEPGEAAALSPGDIDAALSGEDASASMTDDDISPESGQSEGMGGQAGETSNRDSDTMTDDNNDNESPDVDALLQRVDEKDDKIDELEAELSDVREDLAEKNDEVEQAARAYAEALADETVFSEDELVERFEVEELREKVDNTEGASLADTEPDVQSGGSESEETASLSDGEQAEAAEHREAIAELAGSQSRIAEIEREQRAEQLAELTGEDPETILEQEA